MLTARSLLAFGVVLQLGACDQWSLFVNSDGVLSISIVSDSDHLQGRYRVRARQSSQPVRVRDVPPSGQLTLEDVGSGLLELTLLAPEECRVSSPNPRTLRVGADETINVAFDVQCGS